MHLLYSLYPSSNSDIKGIFQQLSETLKPKAEGEVNNDNLVKQPENVFNDEVDENCWYSPNEEGATITLSFSKYSLFVTNYSIQAPYMSCSQNYVPKEWSFYGFNGESWVLLSSIDDAGFINYGQIKTYSVTELNHFETFNKFKFVGGRNSNRNTNYIFAIQAIDLFGNLFDTSSTLRLTNFPLHTFSILFLIFFIK